MRRARALTALVTAVALSAVVAAPVSAHVTVNPREAEQGGFTKLTFRMPNERDNASTVKLEVVFPDSQPLASVSVKPKAGWPHQVERVALPKPVDVEGRQITETVRSIVWTAQPRAELKPGTFEEFDVSAGRLPADEQMVFKAIQTYSNGEVVSWIEEAAPGATARPEHPAPVLKLLPAADPVELAAAEKAAQETEDDQSRNASLALVLSIVALLVGAAGLVLVLLGRRRGTASAG